MSPAITVRSVAVPASSRDHTEEPCCVTAPVCPSARLRPNDHGNRGPRCLIRADCSARTGARTPHAARSRLFGARTLVDVVEAAVTSVPGCDWAAITSLACRHRCRRDVLRPSAAVDGSHGRKGTDLRNARSCRKVRGPADVRRGGSLRQSTVSVDVSTINGSVRTTIRSQAFERLAKMCPQFGSSLSGDVSGLPSRWFLDDRVGDPREFGPAAWSCSQIVRSIMHTGLWRSRVLLCLLRPQRSRRSQWWKHRAVMKVAVHCLWAAARLVVLEAGRG